MHEEGAVILPEAAPDEPFVHTGRPPDPTVRELQREPNPLRRALRIAGPGLVAGAADDDPSGIGTYAQAGAQFGYATLWLMPLLLPFMIAVQYLCARIALVSGRGLADVMKRRYPRPLVLTLVGSLLVVNVITAGADVGAMAAAAGLFVPVGPLVLILAVTAGLLLLQLFVGYAAAATIFRWLALALVGYVVSGILARPDPGAVLRGAVLPTISFDPSYVGIVVAVLGTTINPYLFFWQASMEVEEQVAKGRWRLWQRQGATDSELRYRAWDVSAGMLFSQLVAFFIVMCAGATLWRTGQHDITSAAQAAESLRPMAGSLAHVLFAVGILGTGILAVPVLTGSAAYALSETFEWPFGLDAPPYRAPQFYAIIVLATLAAMGFDLLGIDPMRALVLSSALSGLLTPPLLVLLMRLGNDPTVMGERTNGRLLNVLGWTMTGVMTLAALALVGTTILG
ncbi:MAG TPA: divalent metal cation transporter [Candidatus Limnocylindrales bacterium]